MPDNDSEPYTEDDIPEEDDDDDDEEDDDYEEDYKVGRLSPVRTYSRMDDGWVTLPCSVQSPPSTQTPDKKDDDTEGTMPPYDPQTQELIDGKRYGKTLWLSESVFSYEWLTVRNGRRKAQMWLPAWCEFKWGFLKLVSVSGSTKMLKRAKHWTSVADVWLRLYVISQA